jgi:hypothetical protein
MAPTCSSRSAPAPAATRRRSSPATCCACTALRRAPRLARRDHRAPDGEHGGYKESSSASRATASTRASSSSPARTACSACRRPSPRAASTPPPAPWPSCRRPRRWRRWRSTRRPARRHLPRLRRRRPARQQDRLRRAHHAPADGHRRRVPGRALPAQEPRPRHGAAAGEAHVQQPRRSRPRSRRIPPQPGRQRRPLRAHPHLQFPAGAGHGPPHQPHPVQARRGHARGDLDRCSGRCARSTRPTSSPRWRTSLSPHASPARTRAARRKSSSATPSTSRAATSTPGPMAPWTRTARSAIARRSPSAPAACPWPTCSARASSGPCPSRSARRR